MAQPTDALRLLEADLQALSLQASRLEGGVFGGLFSSGSRHLDPDVRDAAENALARLRAGAAFASEPPEEKTKPPAPALRAVRLACASPSPDVALAGLRCAQRLVANGFGSGRLAPLSSDDLCALADALGAAEKEETEDDDERFDAVATRKAQTLLQTLELDACFRDERVAKRLFAACFRALASANARAGRTDRRVVAAEAAAFRACERAFEAAASVDDDRRARDAERSARDVVRAEDEAAGGTSARGLGTATATARFASTEQRVAFGVFCELCDAAAGDDARESFLAMPGRFKPSPRFAFDALTRALSVEPLARNPVLGLETAGGAFGVAAIKNRLCAALVTKTFSDAMASPGASRRRDPADAVAEGRAAARCAGAFLRFARPRRRNVKHARTRTLADTDALERVSARAAASAPPPSAKSSFFAFLSPSRPRHASSDDEDDQGVFDASPRLREAVSTPTGAAAAGKEGDAFDATEHDVDDPFAAERRLFLGSFASSLEGEMAPWRRSAALDVLRSVAGDPELLRHARGDGAGTGNASPDAFGDVTDILARVAEAGVSPFRGDDDAGDATRASPPDSTSSREEDSVPLRVASAFRDASNAARHTSRFREPEDSDETGHVAHAVFLALEGVLALCSSLETLADESVYGEDAKYVEDARAMVERAWVPLESCLSTAFRRVPGEAAALELSRAYQALTRAAAAVGAEEAKDACLASLCAFSGSDSRETAHQQRKSAHAFRALLNTAQSLVTADALGFRGWFAMLETMRRVEALRVAERTSRAADGQPASAGPGPRARATESESGAVADALLASATALVASSAALRDEQSAEALEAARGSSACEMEEAGLGAPLGAANARASLGELRATARFVDAVLLRVRGSGGDARKITKERARAAWHTLETHFRDALDSALEPEVARRACAHLARAVVGALEEISAAEAEAPLDAAEVLAPLARAKARARCLPARLEAVEAISVLVRERGDLLAETAGWAAAFDALRAGDVLDDAVGGSGDVHGNGDRRRRARKDDAASAVAGWSAAAHVVSDALPLLPLSAADAENADAPREPTGRRLAGARAVARVVPLLSSYARQTDDTRTSLSAVNALWNACDVVARRAEKAKDEASRSLSETFLLRALEALAAAGVDRTRPDVRHSGVNTLAKLLAARGATLSPGAWREATLGVFFPLVFEIRARAAAAGDERVGVSSVPDADDAADADGSEAAEARASSVFLVHHSRNTVAKQWDETLSAAVAAVGELVRRRAARLLARDARDAFEPVWDRTCAFVVECVTSASQETASAATRAARTAATRFAAVSVEGEGSGDETNPDFSVRASARAAFKAVTRGVYETATRLATSDGEARKRVTSRTRAELVKTLAETFAAVPPSAFDRDDVAVVVAVADAMARAPEPWPERRDDAADDDSNALGSGYAALQTQRACFDALASLVPNVSDACVDAGAYVSVLHRFLSYVDGEIGSDDGASRLDASPTQPRAVARANPACAALACDAFATLATHPKLPEDDLACAFARAVSAFAAAMAPSPERSRMKDAAREADIDKVGAATRAFHATLDRGVPAAQRYVSAAGGADALRRSWGVIADAFEASVPHAPEPPRSRLGAGAGTGVARSGFASSARRREADALWREGLEALRDACARGDSAPESVRSRLVRVLAAGAEAELDAARDSAASACSRDDRETVASRVDGAFPSQCLYRLRDLVRSAGAGPGAASAARLAAPALLATCESALRRHAAEESPRGGSSADGASFAVSAARATVAARALASGLAPAPGAGGGSGGGFFFRKETPATVLAAAATPERARAARGALEACATSTDVALRDAAGKALEALSRLEETRAS